jgi:hypothetical protein
MLMLMNTFRCALLLLYYYYCHCTQERELRDIANRLRPPVADFNNFLDVLRSECYLLKRGAHVYQAQNSSFSQSQRSQPSQHDDMMNSGSSSSSRGGRGGGSRRQW